MQDDILYVDWLSIYEVAVGDLSFDCQSLWSLCCIHTHIELKQSTYNVGCMSYYV